MCIDRGADFEMVAVKVAEWLALMELMNHQVDESPNRTRTGFDITVNDIAPVHVLNSAK